MSRVPIVAIVGRANVGKSSLFNAMLGRREAIVADEEGTTRDAIYGKVSLDDQHDFWLVDTAGLKSAQDDFELSIQEQISQAATDADIILVVVEAAGQITEEDRRVAKLALRSKKPVILLINKSDRKVRGADAPYERLGIKTTIRTSAIHKIGFDKLENELEQLLPTATIREDDNRIHLALLGRPNVGKSSLFNKLARKQQAIVADRAGTTRDINRAIVKYHEREIELLDTAGIRRSGKIERGVEHFSVLRALSAIEQADICLLLIDANEPRVALDQKIAGMVKEAGKGLVIVVSKWDAVEDKTAYTRDSMAPLIATDFDFVPWAPLIFTSSVTGQNTVKIFDLTLQIMKRRSRKIATTELNRWLRHQVDRHPPAGLKNRQPKLRYMVQEQDNPIPAFKIFGKDTRFVHWSYRRFLESAMRETFDYIGSPIQLWFIENGAKDPDDPDYKTKKQPHLSNPYGK